MRGPLRWLAGPALGLFALALAAPQLLAEKSTYLGRTIAPTMSHHGAGWLVREEREEEENTDLLLEQLRLEPGDVACDVGAGNGYHALRMAKHVEPDGRVIAVDIQPEMLALLKRRAQAAGVANVETRLGEPGDPKLKPETCDLVLLVDVYHELADPGGMLEHLKRALKPDGTIALVEFRANDPSVPIKPLHTMTKAQMKKELAASGLEPVRSFDGLPWQHLIFFGPAKLR